MAMLVRAGCGWKPSFGAEISNLRTRWGLAFCGLIVGLSTKPAPARVSGSRLCVGDILVLKPILFYLLIILFDGSVDINFSYCFALTLVLCL